MYAEQRLWLAVIDKAVEDITTHMDQAIRQQELYGAASDRIKRNVDQVMHEIMSPWFAELCEYAELHVDWVIKLLKRQSKQSGYHKVRYVQDNQLNSMAVKEQYVTMRYLRQEAKKYGRKDSPDIMIKSLAKIMGFIVLSSSRIGTHDWIFEVLAKDKISGLPDYIKIIKTKGREQ